MRNNLFDVIPNFSKHEKFIDLLSTKNIKIEKIISYGQVTSTDTPYIQQHDEWVLVLKGNAKLKLEDKEYTLEQGEYLFIPKNIKHWVTYTDNPTIWLAIRIKE
ncbi:cupin domain-containing protein [Allofrancisella guangzhouensis]|uniref:Cupin n=2 Tax=Allofrancisella guangzhouensis TaxID=594679 RepID=A0A0A8E502_9GAMM|nr:cupin domain-containing protein [Allofrancisella guangzhouensis]AJC48662.1 cupin [Allofrancisella guangzhouensis]MBK2044493.1 cupin domain-containing protein [Allofrancisella guangzhouensis]